MTSRRVPEYRLHRSSGRAVVTIGGRDFYLGKHGSPESQAEYRRLLGEWLASAAIVPLAPTRRAVTVGELMLAYVQHAKQHYRKGDRPTSELALVKRALSWVRPNYAHTEARAFSPLALKAVRDAMVRSTSKDGSGLEHPTYCRITINLHVGRIRRMFRWAVENEFVDASVYQALVAVRDLQRGRTTARDSEPVRPVLDEHVSPVRAAVSRQVAAMIELQRLTGMRPGEVVQMRARDLATSGELWTYRPSSHKTAHHGKDRVVTLGPRAQEIVRPFLKPDLASCLFSPKDAVVERNAKLRAARKTPMTPSQANRRPKADPKKTPKEHYTTCSYARAIAVACAKTGTPHWHPNQLAPLGHDLPAQPIRDRDRPRDPRPQLGGDERDLRGSRSREGEGGDEEGRVVLVCLGTSRRVVARLDPLLGTTSLVELAEPGQVGVPLDCQP